ncbi:hypothetical protein MJO28_011182 [Puccinia striiformis f. sp. tritici]|uniref:G-patch domain-containing protein n=2 Tax=Puccinia striiformis f. sp. tritici TaxID=168172 RepID=A0A0L0V9A3_9BASI|nr:hypothetical protein Pst134EA_020894 [Puccinia striiformis f. sp. tritici]KAI9621852.1 hypothetical protein KEM48_007523 [Puccinia striiformis f. sp. tritici PST-130]KNE95867.1 hypothetical protein PSTG_10785 [Puccinia striiformis f. sp. tritici PST-78]KAH9456988.1 hypothetical protein Pst134EA_020894 [Puccinia striiformis f. sp. tritici]KAI7943654.1 hypothetical protein MJO28_011182 [Puccinia striiformis f. sp. tritici]KAI7946445.1 hypothetical protein MJO29_010972 [Puccinia striiformis f.
MLGTPLPPLTSTKADQNVFQPIWKQEVTDEQGRRRLHGAFTGGFSAGYFNTVGSKDGWNPAEFKSSRADKKSQSKGFSQKPEDFMDEEDLAELAQSKELQTNSNFGSTSTNPSHLPRKIYDPLTGAIEKDPEKDLLGRQSSRPSAIDIAFSDLVQPSNVRAGQKIMRKMGWRDGQGIGPRITHERRLLLASKLGVDFNQQLDLEDDPERKKHLYAPIDRPLKPIQPWPGVSGLGHSRPAHSAHLDHPFASSTHTHSSTEAKNSGSTIPKGSSFGLGALNDIEDDDHDVYAPAFDQVTSDPRARRLLKLSEENTSSHKAPDRQSTKTTNRSASRETKVFQDNTPLPTGFRTSTTPTKGPTSASFVPPLVPEKWKPCPAQIWEAARSKVKPLEAQANSRHPTRPINAHDRARLIGEEAPPKSVFDFISAKDKARLTDAKLLAQASLESKVSKDGGDLNSVAQLASIRIPELDPSIAQAALRGFMPFSHDLNKQERYKLYLQSQAGMLPKGTQFSPKVTSQMTVDVINKELDGFIKSAMMFKPMSAMMASRFTSAASTSAGGEMAAPEPGLRQPVFLEEQPEDIITQEKGSEEPTIPEVVSQAAQAVRMDMFGMMTRSTKNFYPHKLLCKRFNVPNPFPDGPPVEPAPKTTNTNLTDFLTSQGFQQPATNPIEATDDSNEQKSGEDNAWLQSKTNHSDGPQSVERLGLAGDETQGREILTSSRPPIDLFKAIFADNSDDEDSHDKLDDLVNEPNELILSENPVRVTEQPPDSTFKTTEQVISLTPIVVDPKAIENLTSFRPTFRVQTTKEEDTTMDSNEVVSTSNKKMSKKKKRPVLISFEEDQIDDINESKQKNKKKKKLSKTQDKKSNRESVLQSETTSQNPVNVNANVNDPDEDEWVESVVHIPPPPVQPKKSIPNEPTSSSSKPYKKLTRMKASDMMD